VLIDEEGPGDESCRGFSLAAGKLLAPTPNRRITPRMEHCQHHDSGIFDDVVDKEWEVASPCPPDIRKNRRRAVRRLCYQ
jgi:hypothetical protein